MLKVVFFLPILLLMSCASSSHSRRSLASLSQLNGYWTQVRSGCNLVLTTKEVMEALRGNQFMSLSTGALDLQDGVYNIYFSAAKECDQNSTQEFQVLPGSDEASYCGKKLHNRGEFDKVKVSRNYKEVIKDFLAS